MPGEFAFIRLDSGPARRGDSPRVVGRPRGRLCGAGKPSLRGRLLVTTDMLMEGVDFVLAEAGPRRVGRKAMAVNLSDIAAMAGVPTAAVVSVALPKNGGREIGEELFLGMRDVADAFQVAIVGGDTNSWDRRVGHLRHGPGARANGERPRAPLRGEAGGLDLRHRPPRRQHPQPSLRFHAAGQGSPGASCRGRSACDDRHQRRFSRGPGPHPRREPLRGRAGPDFDPDCPGGGRAGEPIGPISSSSRPRRRRGFRTGLRRLARKTKGKGLFGKTRRFRGFRRLANASRRVCGWNWNRAAFPFHPPVGCTSCNSAKQSFALVRSRRDVENE